MKALYFTDSINECDCCGRTELKGTYLVVDEYQNEYYYGSVCATKLHGITADCKKDLKLKFNKDQKNKKLYSIHIEPIKQRLAERLEETFTTTNFEELTDVSKSIYSKIVTNYNDFIIETAKKYKINLI